MFIEVMVPVDFDDNVVVEQKVQGVEIMDNEVGLKLFVFLGMGELRDEELDERSLRLGLVHGAECLLVGESDELLVDWILQKPRVEELFAEGDE